LTTEPFVSQKVTREKRMKIIHEEAKNTKKYKENLRALRFFVVDFPQEGT
jgi:hypothetical protein